MTHKSQYIGIIVLAAAVLGISLIQFQNSIKAPFARKPSTFKTTEQRDAEVLAQQKSSDTDHDGLSDYDELNLYRTSPYLDDTDSDGYKDGEEVRTNHDPNCPANKTCGAPESESAPAPAAPSLELPPAPETFVGGGAEVFQQFDAKTVRSLLRGAGVPEEALKAIDDATLEQMYLEAVAKTASSTPG